MNITKKIIAQRVRALFTLIIVSFTIIIITLIYLQIYQSDTFFSLGKKNYLRHETIESMRGVIVDCHGRPLATNRPVTNLIWHGTGNKKLNDQQITILNSIETITEQKIEAATIARNERLSKEILIAHDISFEQLSKISEKLAHYPNIMLQKTFARYYPHGQLASHILGYFQEGINARAGKMGLEKIFEKQLQGTPGILEKTINSFGSSLQIKQIKEALKGATITTTLDLELQKIAEKLFDQEQESGTFIIMNPHNGALRVIMSRPTFNPNIFLQPISHEQWTQLLEEQPFINRATNACYPPASLFKLVTTTAGLEEGIVTQESCWTCSGKIQFGGRAYLCNRRYDGHGLITIKDALAQSCNIPFYEIGKKININTIALYAQKFGLGTKTGIILPEQTGLVPTSLWKQTTHNEPWWQGETLNTAIGQGPLLATPLQMGRAIGGICTETLTQPRILENEPITNEPLNISPQTLNFLKESMRMTVEEGTGKKLKQLANMEIFAKTGTCQTSHRSKRKLNKKYLEHAWFICYAQYKEYEPMILIILIENVGTAKFATRMAKNFFVEYCNLKNLSIQ